MCRVRALAALATRPCWLSRRLAMVRVAFWEPVWRSWPFWLLKRWAVRSRAPLAWSWPAALLRWSVFRVRRFAALAMMPCWLSRRSAMVRVAFWGPVVRSWPFWLLKVSAVRSRVPLA